MAKYKEKDTSMQELKAHLKNKDLLRLYFFHGEDRLRRVPYNKVPRGAESLHS